MESFWPLMQAQYKVCVSVIWGMQQRTKGLVNFQELAMLRITILHFTPPFELGQPKRKRKLQQMAYAIECVCASASAGYSTLEAEWRTKAGDKGELLADCPRNKSPDQAHTNRITTITTTGSLSCWRGPLESKIFTHTKSGESPCERVKVCV